MGGHVASLRGGLDRVLGLEPSEHLLIVQCSKLTASAKPQPHFIVEGTKVQRGQGACSRSHS